MNIIPVFSSDRIGRVVDQRGTQTKPSIEIVRKKYIFYPIPEFLHEFIRVPENWSSASIEGKKFKAHEGKLVYKKKYMNYDKLYALLFAGEPRAFLIPHRQSVVKANR